MIVVVVVVVVSLWSFFNDTHIARDDCGWVDRSRMVLQRAVWGNDEAKGKCDEKNGPYNRWKRFDVDVDDVQAQETEKCSQIWLWWLFLIHFLLLLLCRRSEAQLSCGVC